MKTEIWKSVVGYEGLYEVSNIGNVRSLNFYRNKGLIKNLKLCTDKKGYQYVTLNKNGKWGIQKVHKLVAMAFLNHIPDGYNCVIDHINHIPNDNRVENLQIISNRENLSKDKTSSTKKTGVYLNKNTNKYYVQIMKGTTCFVLGTYSDLEYAENLYKRAVEVIDNVSTKEELFKILGIEIKESYSKVSGVTYNRTWKKWTAYTKIDGKRKFLGNFKTEQDAIIKVKEFDEQCKIKLL